MRVMSSQSPINEREGCNSEGTTSASTTSDPTSSMSGLSPSETPLSPRNEAPPPPPLPPPCPGVPPPLPTSLSNHGPRKKRRVRSFFWKPIPEEKVRGKPNIWTMAVRQQQYQIDVRSVEELFGQQEEAGSRLGDTPDPGPSARIARSRSFKEISKDEISILDSKRGMNVGIFLKQFKKSNHSIVEDIRHGDGKLYGAELLKDLLKLLPEPEEIKKLKEFKGDSSKLTLADSFMFLLIQVPRFEVRIEAMVLQEEFFPSCAMMSRGIDVLRVATKELMTCEELHAILHLVLQAGNIMNAGGYAGNAVGFKLSSLLSLADTKANKPGMNLLHFVALEAQKKDENLLKFPEKLLDVQSAARVSVENIESDFSSLYVRTRSLEEKIQEDPELLQQLDPFLQSATRTLQDLKRCRLDLRKEGSALIDFFCEDKDTFKLDECFRIFQDFCIKFKKAVKDNHDRELKEVARQRRLRELEEKRVAWAGADHSAGCFGRSSSENDVDVLSKEGLLDFLQQRPHSPHSPLSRSASARRHRHTMSSMADRQLHSYLEIFGANGAPNAATTEYSKFNSLPRSSRTPQRRTTAWLISQDDNRELGAGRQVTARSPQADTEPISPLARFSSAGFNASEDSNINNNYTSLSEGNFSPLSCNVFQKTPVSSVTTGNMNVNVEKHTLVSGLQLFDLPSPNNNSKHMNLINQGDCLVTDLEREAPPKTLDLKSSYCDPSSDGDPDWEAERAAVQQREEEDSSTVSSTTCDTPLPLDTSVSNKKPPFYIVDCTETDCSVALDYSEVESSSLVREGLVHDIITTDCNNESGNIRDLSSLSSNYESTSTNEQSISTNEVSASKLTDEHPASATQSFTTEEADTDICDTAGARQVGGKPAKTLGVKPSSTKNKGVSKLSKNSGGRAARTLTASETQDMRKVVPITKLARSGSNVRRPERRPERPPGHESSEPGRPLRDQSTPARGHGEKASRTRRHSSLPPEDSKSPRGGVLACGLSRWARDPTPRKPSFRKPSAKPIRNIPKAPHEEKMCRSTLRALAQAQSLGTSAELSAPETPAHCPKTTSGLPSFARNTVASSSRTKELGSVSTPSTPSKTSSILTRTASQRQPSTRTVPPPTAGGQHQPRREEKPQGTNLGRVQNVRASSRSAQRSDTTPPPPAHERTRKSSVFSERSVLSRDSASSCRTHKPSWK